MISHLPYQYLRKWATILCLILLSIGTRAQSDFPTDSVVDEFEQAPDTVSSSPQPVNDTITFRSTPDSIVARMQQMKEFAYANDPDYWTKKKEIPPRRRSSSIWDVLGAVLQYLLFGIFIVVLIYILVKILSDSKIILFKRKTKQMDVPTEEEVVEEKDLASLILAAETKEQFRLATRYRYMQLLENLNARQLIRMHGELTNWDYIRQLGIPQLTPKFRYLTIAYEYVWYGEFELTNDQYGHLKNKFETFFH